MASPEGARCQGQPAEDEADPSQRCDGTEQTRPTQRQDIKTSGEEQDAEGETVTGQPQGSGCRPLGSQSDEQQGECVNQLILDRGFPGSKGAGSQLVT